MNFFNRSKTTLDSSEGAGGRPYREPRGQMDSRGPANPPLFTEKIFSERKVFFIDLKENDRGRFVKITEDVKGRRDTIMVPMENLTEFVEALTRVEQFAKDLDQDS